MNKFLMTLAGIGIAAAALPTAANAAPWQPIGQREVRIEHRIDQGVRSGALTRHEARSLRHRFRDLQRREARYRRHGHRGLDRFERRDLDRRFDALSRQVRYQKHDRQDRYRAHRYR